MNNIIKYSLLSFVLFLFACDKKPVNVNTKLNGDSFFEKLFSDDEAEIPKELSVKDYLSWCEDKTNGLIETKEIGDFRFSAFYKPANYLAISELKNDSIISEKKINEKINDYGSLTYFSFKIENTKQQDELIKINLDSESDYYGRLEYFSFKMQQDFKLIQNNDTVDCGLYHFERIYGLAPHATFVLGFPVQFKSNADIKLWYQDKIFKNGIIILNFKSKAINNLPKLKI